MENGAHHMTSTCDLIRRGHHDVLTDRKVAENPSYLNRGLTLVRRVAHHDEQIYIAPLVGDAARLRAEQHDARRLETYDDALYHG